MIRFISKHGIGNSTQILDAETGEDLQKIIAVKYGATIEIGQMVSAKCELMMCEIDMVANKTVFTTRHPISRDYLPVAAIEFRDGVRIEIAEDGTPSVRPSSG